MPNSTKTSCIGVMVAYIESVDELEHSSHHLLQPSIKCQYDLQVGDLHVFLVVLGHLYLG